MFAYGPDGGGIVATTAGAAPLALALLTYAAHNGVPASCRTRSRDCCTIEVGVTLLSGCCCACAAERLAFLFAQEQTDNFNGLVEVAHCSGGVQLHLEFGGDHVAEILHNAREDGGDDDVRVDSWRPTLHVSLKLSNFRRKVSKHTMLAVASPAFTSFCFSLFAQVPVSASDASFSAQRIFTSVMKLPFDFFS